MPQKEENSPNATPEAKLSEEAVDASDGCACEILRDFQAQASDILSDLSPDKRAKLEVFIASRVVSKTHHGPLPSPEDIALYNQHIPNGADRIMRMAERQSEHRMALEKVVITAQQKQSGRGQIFGLVIGLFGIAMGAVVTLQGHDVVGGAIAGTTVVSLVYAFISGQRAQRRDLADKSEPS